MAHWFASMTDTTKPIATPMNTAASARMPAGVWNAHGFQMFNAISFNLVIGTPMVLFFKQHGASATLLGVLLAMAPLLNILQIPAASVVERTGYRSFVLRGWTARSYLIIGMIVTAWLPDSLLSTDRRLGIMLLLLAGYNAIRGFWSCGFLPWMTAWIPEQMRGRFLSRDQFVVALAGATTMWATAIFMRGTATSSKYGVLFAVSFLCAHVSLMFLRRIPDVPVASRSTSSGRVPWMELMRYRPFLRFMTYNTVVCAGLSGACVLWVPMLRDVYAMDNSWVLGIAATTGVTVAIMSLSVGKLADRVGSRPLLGLAGLVFLAHFAGWAALAAQWWTMDVWTAGYVGISAGVAFALFGLANLRLAMTTVPVMGRSHFFALFSVINNLVMGLLPVAWGWSVDRMLGWRLSWGGWEWNRFSLLYALIFLIMAVALVFQRWLTDHRSLSTEEFLYELMVKTPARGLSRLILRRPIP